MKFWFSMVSLLIGILIMSLFLARFSVLESDKITASEINVGNKSYVVIKNMHGLAVCQASVDLTDRGDKFLRDKDQVKIVGMRFDSMENMMSFCMMASDGYAFHKMNVEKLNLTLRQLLGTKDSKKMAILIQELGDEFEGLDLEMKKKEGDVR